MKRLSPFFRVKFKIKSLFIPDGPYGDRKRGKLYEPFLRSCGKNFKVATQSFIYNPNRLSVGDNVYVGFNSYIGQGDVELQDEVIIGNFVSITASNHLRKDGSYRFGGFKAEKIRIGKGTWLGSLSSITAGVEIGSGCVIATGSVVTKSFGDNLIIAGVPAKVIRS